MTSTFDVPPKIVCFSPGAIFRHRTRSVCCETDLFIYFPVGALRRQLRHSQETSFQTYICSCIVVNLCRQNNAGCYALPLLKSLEDLDGVAVIIV